MLIDEISLEGLTENGVRAFVVFERRLRDAMHQAQQTDRELYRDINGNYDGRFEPEREYVSSVVAFLDEYEIDYDLPDISSVPDDEFLNALGGSKIR